MEPDYSHLDLEKCTGYWIYDSETVDYYGPVDTSHRQEALFAASRGFSEFLRSEHINGREADRIIDSLNFNKPFVLGFTYDGTHVKFSEENLTGGASMLEALAVLYLLWVVDTEEETQDG